MDNIFVKPTAFAFGFHISSPFQKEDEAHIGYSRLKKYVNITHLAGYIPLLGIISGVALLVLLICKPLPVGSEAYEGFRNVELVRACFQILGYGSLFMIPDLIVTIGRELAISIKNAYHKSPTKKVVT